MTSMSGCALISSLMPSRMVSWSSAIMTRSLLIVFTPCVVLNQRHAHKNRCPLARRGFDLEAAAGDGGALAHADQPQPGAAAAARRLAHVKSLAIVLDDQHHLRPAPLKHDLDLCSLGVLQD